MIEWESTKALVNRRYAYEECLRRHLSNGCIALVLGEGDEEALKNFQVTGGYAPELVAAPPTPGGGVRTYEANADVPSGVLGHVAVRDLAIKTGQSIVCIECKNWSS